MLSDRNDVNGENALHQNARGRLHVDERKIDIRGSDQRERQLEPAETTAAGVGRSRRSDKTAGGRRRQRLPAAEEKLRVVASHVRRARQQVRLCFCL